MQTIFPDSRRSSPYRADQSPPRWSASSSSTGCSPSPMTLISADTLFQHTLRRHSHERPDNIGTAESARTPGDYLRASGNLPSAVTPTTRVAPRNATNHRFHVQAVPLPSMTTRRAPLVKRAATYDSPISWYLAQCFLALTARRRIDQGYAHHLNTFSCARRTNRRGPISRGPVTSPALSDQAGDSSF